MFRLIMLFCLLTLTTICFSQNYKIGEKVAVWHTGWYPAKVIEIKNGLYNVDYYDWTGYPDEWVKENRVKTWGSAREYKEENSTNTPKNKPEKINNIPNIVGTSWAVISIYQKGTIPTVGKMDNYIFCKSGHWEFSSNAIADRGTYKVKGNQLSITGQGNKTSTYTMIWYEAKNYLELDDGVMIIRLQFTVKTSC